MCRRHATYNNDQARQDFLSYVLSLVRGTENEHADTLPKVDVTSLRHVAFVLDALIYYLRNNPLGALGKFSIHSVDRFVRVSALRILCDT